MTQQLHSPIAPDARLDSLLRIAQDRSARGNASRRDWERVAAIDADRAYRELRDFLRRTGNAPSPRINPYEKRSVVPGALIGFAAGIVAMLVTWALLPELRERWIDHSLLYDMAASAQTLSSLLVPAGVVLGVRWSRRHTVAETPDSLLVSRDATFDDLLEAFERTQHIGRARVY